MWWTQYRRQYVLLHIFPDAGKVGGESEPQSVFDVTFETYKQMQGQRANLASAFTCTRHPPSKCVKAATAMVPHSRGNWSTFREAVGGKQVQTKENMV